MRTSSKRLFTLGTVVALSSLLMTSALAEIKRFAFSGTVGQVSTGTGGVLDGSITNGSPFEGYYTFDITAADSNSDPTVGDYRFTNSAFGLVVRMGSYVFRTDPRRVDFLIEVVNRPGQDNYLLRSYQNLGSQGVIIEHIAWQLDDRSGTALSNDLLLPTPPVLSAFESIFGLTVEGGCSSLFIRGRVTSIREEAAPPS